MPHDPAAPHPRRRRTLLASRLARARLAAKSPDEGPVSVAHDDRFVVAARGTDAPVGVDAERIDGRALRVARTFLDDDERAVLAAGNDGLTVEEAAVRAWSAKECVGKALGVGLGKVVEEARVRSIGRRETVLDGPRGETWRVRHAEVEGHVISITSEAWMFQGGIDARGR